MESHAKFFLGSKISFFSTPQATMVRMIKGAYYAIHHMRAIVRDHHQLLLPSKLKDWAASVSAIQDADLRQELFRIQSEFAEIIHQDVLRTSGQFYLKYQPSNSEIDTTLQMQADNARDFMTITTDGGFIHAPVP